ncbi:hypothetical protein Nepgr_000140 [Nepenthes gracilis]|uniref:Uncharacterized protein n=1 Tax=Nepenthes gracilis TaxID=150966 RepID=A0AAD3P2P9_NEPGR|nr:hypothetical protein Nepgr_000140 [Nepenthes gracilis]
MNQGGSLSPGPTSVSLWAPIRRALADSATRPTRREVSSGVLVRLCSCNHHLIQLITPTTKYGRNFKLFGIKWANALKSIGSVKEDYHFWLQVGKALICTFALLGAGWLYNETLPLGWWTLKPRPKDERELAHLYERREFPYPGDKEAMEEFIAKGDMIGTAVGPKGIIDPEKDSCNYQKTLHDMKFEQDAQKL